MTSKSPLLTLNNGVQIPAIGLGVFQSSPEQTVTAVESAIAQGYRLIDTAASYGNERQVGEGIRRSGVARDDMIRSPDPKLDLRIIQVEHRHAPTDRLPVRTDDAGANCEGEP